MTNLTEQWKKGELQNDWYYIRTTNGIEKWEYIKQSHGFGYEEDVWVVEVLAPVPSYEEWQAKDEENKNLYKMLDVLNRHLDSLLKEDKENQQLKELLKECGRQLEEVELCRYDVADVDQEDWFRISTEQAGIAKKMKTKIDNAIGEKR